MYISIIMRISNDQTHLHWQFVCAYKNIQKHGHTVGQLSRFPSHLLAHFPPRQVRERSPRTGVLLRDMNHRHFASLASAYVPTKRPLTLSYLSILCLSKQLKRSHHMWIGQNSKLSLYSHKGRWLLVFIPIYLIRVSFFIPIKGDGYPTTSRGFEKVIKS